MNLDSSVVSEHVDVGCFSSDDELGFVGNGGRSAKMSEFGNGGTRFEIGFSIEILGFDEANVLLLRSSANDEI